MFQCLKCGSCCRNLRVHSDPWELGLFLLPAEAHLLFAENDIAPMWGIGIKGKSRPRPAQISFMQLKTKNCPHITDKNLCRIYLQRPIVCRAHPLSIAIDPHTNLPRSASLDARCKAAEMLPHDTEANLKKFFDSQTLTASVDCSLHILQMFKNAIKGTVWLYDLKTCKWIEVTSSNASALLQLRNVLGA